MVSPTGASRRRATRSPNQHKESACCYHPSASSCWLFHAMPNIKQQKKRVRITTRQRGENIRFRSTVKTLTKRLEAAVEAGDTAAVAEEHHALVRWVDRAASKGAI